MKIIIDQKTITMLCILFFLLSMYSIGTISAISVSWTFTLVFLILSILTLLYNQISRSVWYVNNFYSCWLILSVLCFAGVLRGGSAVVLVFYGLLFALLLLCNSISIDGLLSSLTWLKYFGILFSTGCIWQFFFPEQYYTRLYPLFGEAYQQSIRRQFTYHRMCTGFTSQTAVAAGFIVLGIMSVLYLNNKDKSAKNNTLRFIEMSALLLGLLLTGKRSPLLNLVTAVIVVDILAEKRNKRVTRIIRAVLMLTIMISILFLVAPLLPESRNSIVRTMESIRTDDLGELSNGRLYLYSMAFKEFMENPIVGIGWGNFSRLYNITGVHNIYLQLLCECGLFGFSLAIGALFYPLVRTISLLKRSSSNSLSLVKCSLFIQIYILVYGVFGNPLYDQNYMLMYFFGIFIIAAVTSDLKSRKITSGKI